MNIFNLVFKLKTKSISLTGLIFFNLQNHPAFHSEESMVNLVRGRECFVGVAILLVYWCCCCCCRNSVGLVILLVYWCCCCCCRNSVGRPSKRKRVLCWSIYIISLWVLLLLLQELCWST